MRGMYVILIKYLFSTDSMYQMFQYNQIGLVMAIQFHSHYMESPFHVWNMPFKIWVPYEWVQGNLKSGRQEGLKCC